MTQPVNPFDHVLAIQLTVAWAGEGRCQPQRLGWWDTDLVDEDGGGDLFGRLLPRTKTWAGLEAARVAARRTDEALRQKIAQPDEVQTLFHLGFDIDERVDRRLVDHKRRGDVPADVLGPAFAVASDAFERDAFESYLRELASGEATAVPGGRQMKGRVPESPDEIAARLASALLPLSDNYPMPFYTP